MNCSSAGWYTCQSDLPKAKSLTVTTACNVSPSLKATVASISLAALSTVPEIHWNLHCISFFPSLSCTSSMCLQTRSQTSYFAFQWAPSTRVTMLRGILMAGCPRIKGLGFVPWRGHSGLTLDYVCRAWGKECTGLARWTHTMCIGLSKSGTEQCLAKLCYMPNTFQEMTNL